METVPSVEHGQDDHSTDRYFIDALNYLVSIIGAKGAFNEKDNESSPSANLVSAALERAKEGYVEVVTYNNEKFVFYSRSSRSIKSKQ